MVQCCSTGVQENGYSRGALRWKCFSLSQSTHRCPKRIQNIEKHDKGGKCCQGSPKKWVQARGLGTTNTSVCLPDVGCVSSFFHGYREVLQKPQEDTETKRER